MRIQWLLWNLMKAGNPTGSDLAHIGIAVGDLDRAIDKYVLLTGGKPTVIEEVPDQKVRVVFLKGGSAGGEETEPSIELLSPTSKDSPLGKFLSRHGEGLHHICLYVDDMERKLKELKTAGVRLIDSVPREGASGSKIAFVHPSGCNGVLIELIERPR